MSKYHMLFDYLHYGNVVMKDERIVAVVPDFRDAEFWANALNQETAPLLETIATQALALEAQSERIAALEKFIRDIADSAMPEKEVNQALLFRATVRDAKTFMQGTLAPDAPVSAPKFKVGQSVRSQEGIELKEYPAGAFDTITEIEQRDGQFWYALSYWNDKHHHNHRTDWSESELEIFE